ncbi:MAG TPA: HAD-IC family P-type ATPase, partial [Cryomorphaceae bacterium]|nr:HAD-IC family P-type ATPase [Cryomorphaceae bacterium]
VTTILTDKTGTITESVLTVKKMFIDNDLETDVSGQGYQLKGTITAKEENLSLGEDSRFDKMALIAAYCNNANIKHAEVEEEEEEQEKDEGKTTKDKKVKKDKKIVEDDEKKEIYKKEEFRDVRYEDGKKVIEEHHEETEKKILKESSDGDEKKQKTEVEDDREDAPSREGKKEPEKRGEEKVHDEKQAPRDKTEGADDEKEEEKDKQDKETKQKAEESTPSLKEADELPDDPEHIEVTGDPTEAALKVMSIKAGVQMNEAFANLKVVDDLPFNSEAKYRGTLVEYPDGHREIFAVGAPEKILNLSSKIITKEDAAELDDELREKIRSKTDAFTEDAMRVVALAYKEVSKDKETVETDDISDLVWTGITGIVDPPRDGVKEAILAARDAGIRVIMVTGDHKKTAAAIAEQVGIIDDGEGAISADEIEEEREAFGKQVMSTNVFARVDPDTKLRIAEYLQDEGELVGMTGDGVNDAPALKRADVGIAMGQRGTDVAKDSAAIVLSDDNFSTIVNAIEEGRIVFKNVRNTSFFLITTNFASTMTIVVSIALGFPLPLLAAQILFVNLVTDGIMDVALATEPGHGDVMKQKPYGRDEHILNRTVIPYIVLVGGLMITLSVLVFKYYLPQGVEIARTGAFLTIAMTQLFNAFNMRAPDRSVFRIGFLTNKWVLLAFLVSLVLQMVVLKVPFFQELFTFGNLPWLHIAVIFLLSSSVLIFGEIYKFLKNKFDWNI